jgi:predicted P-loop ATPase
MLVAAVRRVRKPGTKFDTIVVLEGEQGTGKSTAVTILAGRDYFGDQDILALDAKAQMEALEGVWLYEIPELAGMRMADVEKIKAFASRWEDRARPAYGRFRENRPRRCIFIGTTNAEEYLRDQTGNRRFWPVATRAIDLETLERDRDQLWAEAATLEARGESIVLPRALWPAAFEAQEKRLEGDPWVDVLADVSGSLINGAYRVSTKVVWEKLGIPPEGQYPTARTRLNDAMRRLGWTSKVFKMNGHSVRGFERAPAQGELPLGR